QNVINFCFQGNTFYCQFVQRQGNTATGTILGVTSSNQNLNAQRTNGVDLEADYAVPMDSWFTWWDGTLGIRSVFNYLGINTQNIAGSPSLHNAGNIGSSLPHLRG